MFRVSCAINNFALFLSELELFFIKILYILFLYFLHASGIKILINKLTSKAFSNFLSQVNAKKI